MPSTRRSFLAGTSAFALTSHRLLQAAAMGTHLLFVGTETNGKSTSKGIYTFAFDPATGLLEQMALAAETIAPTFLALSRNGHALYAVNENGFPDAEGKPGAGGTVTGYTFNAARQTLTQINQVSSGGAFPVYISTDRTGRCVFAANYAGGSMASYRVDAAGKLSDPVSTFVYPSPPDAPTKHSHAHRVTVSPDDRFLLVNDLGLDRIHIYALNANTAELTPHGEWAAGPGDGPRALRFHPNGKIAYCVNETQPTVHVLSWNPAAPASSQLTTIQTLRLANSPDQCHPGDIVLDATAKHAYVSTRRDNTVAICSVATDGRLSQTGKIGSGGVRPRDLTLDPTGKWLLVANQDSNNISVFKRDPKTGMLSDPKISVALDQPMCLVFSL